MIRTYFWPSNLCDIDKWDTYINRAIELQADLFPRVEITTTRIRQGNSTFHESTAAEIESYLESNKLVSSIHFILIGTNDVQEEYRDTFPERFLKLDLLARVSRNQVIAVIDVISLELSHLKNQLSSITNVQKTCTVIKNFASTKSNSAYSQPSNADQRGLSKLTYSAITTMVKLTDLMTLSVEP